jgi:hypothetical protein
MKKLMFTVALAATAGAIYAQEAGVPPAAPETTVAAAAAVASDNTLAVAAAASDDGGAAIIAMAEEKASEVAALPDEPGESALNKVNTDLETMGIAPGYDAEKKAIIQVAQADIEMPDPAKDPAFMAKREQIGNFALLQAKAEIIRAIYTEFSAMDRALTKFDEESNPAQERFMAAKAAVEEKRAELAEAIAQYNAADAKTVSDVTLNDRFGSFIDAVIKKIDSSYDPGAIAASKKIDAAAAKVEAEALKEKAKMLAAEYKALEEAAAKLPQEPALETESTASMLSKMPLLGASVLTQAESWDPGTKQYSVAVAVVWSPKLQSCALKIGTGDFTAAGKPGKFSKLDWVKAQDWCSMIGTRRFTDDKGNNYFVGIGAIDPGLGVQANAKRMLAETLARKNVAMALIGDLETQREVKQNLKVYADQSTATKQKIVDAIASKVDLHLKGCLSLAKKEVKHPITGKRIYVSAYYIDPALAKEAGETMKKMFADAGLVAQHTNKQRGVVEGATKAYGAVKNDPSARAAGAAEGASAVNAKVEAEKRAAAEKARAAAEKAARARAEDLKRAQANKQAQEAANKAAAEKRAADDDASAVSTGGTHSGGTIDTDF